MWDEVFARLVLTAGGFMVGYVVSMNKWRLPTQADPAKLRIASVFYVAGLICAAVALTVGIASPMLSTH